MESSPAGPLAVRRSPAGSAGEALGVVAAAGFAALLGGRVSPLVVVAGPVVATVAVRALAA